MERNRTFAVEVRDVFSGDDLVVMVDLDIDGLWKRQRVRLHDVDTPNAVNIGDDSEAGRVRKLVRGIARGRPGRITVRNRGHSSWVVDLVVETPDGPLNLNEYLIKQGYKFKR